MSQNLVLSRRRMLRGILGGAAIAIGLPPLEAMLDSSGSAFADGEPIPKRFGLWFWGNGVKQDRWIPSTTGTGWHASPPPSLQPFADAGVIDRVSVVTHTWVPFPFNWAHHTSYKALMAASQPVDSDGVPDWQSKKFPEKFGGPTVIDLVTGALGPMAKFPRIDARISRAVSGADYLTGDPKSSQHDPKALFDKLFSDFQPTSTPPSQGLINARKSVLDAVAADAADLQKRLGAADKKRLEQHLAGIASVEQSVQHIQEVVCTLPPEPAPRPPDLDGNGEPLQEVSRAMSDLCAYAFACDLSRVFDFTFMDLQSSPHFWQVGVTDGHHGLGHDEPGSQPQIQKTVVYMMGELAYLCGKLDAIQVGSGSLLDHCCIWGTSEQEDPQSHGFFNIPQLVIGRAGGALKGGVHHDAKGIGDYAKRLEVPSAIHARLALTMMRAVGVDQASFGSGDGHADQTMPELES